MARRTLSKPRYSRRFARRRKSFKPKPELKRLEVSQSGWSTFSSGTNGYFWSNQLTNLITRGTDNDERIGRKVQLKCLTFYGEFMGASDVADVQTLRVCIVQSYGLYPLDSWSATYFVPTFYNHWDRGRFKVLMDQRFHLKPWSGYSGLVEDKEMVQYVHKWKTGKSATVTWNDFDESAYPARGAVTVFCMAEPSNQTMYRNYSITLSFYDV